MTQEPHAPATQDDRAGLEEASERYLQALVHGDPALAGLSPDVVFAENDQPLPVGEASWRTIEALVRRVPYGQPIVR